jgi:hypothetical protein
MSNPKLILVDSIYIPVRDRIKSMTEIVYHSWFEEFDFYDLDRNKFKVWKPNEA